MATMNTLLGSNIKWNYHNKHFHAPPIPTSIFHVRTNLMSSSSSSSRGATLFTTRLSVICNLPAAAAINSKEYNLVETSETTEIVPSKNPIEILTKTAILFVGFLLFWHPNSSLAASGGRMGGSSFRSSSSSRSPSKSSSSRSYSSRSSSKKSSSRSSSKKSSSRSPSTSPSRSYSQSLAYDLQSLYSPSSPKSSCSCSCSSSCSCSANLVSLGTNGKVDDTSVVLSSDTNGKVDDTEKFHASVAVSSVSDGAVVSKKSMSGLTKFLIGGTVLVVLCVGAYIIIDYYNTEKTSIIKLQVGLLGEARSLQTDLNQIARSVDTSTKEGLIYILQETACALLRLPHYCMFGYSSVDKVMSIDEAEERFKKHSIREMAKFDEITLVNVNNVRREVASSQKATGVTNDYIVVTILAAVQGRHKLPTINGKADLKEALEKLSSLPLSGILAVEVLWTPQRENDTLSEEEFRMNYSLLHPL